MQITAYSWIFTISCIAFGCWMVWLILELVPGVQTLSQISGIALPSLVQHRGVRCLLLCVLHAMHFPESWSPGTPEQLAAVMHLHLLHWKLLQIISPRFTGSHWSFACISFLSSSPSTSTCTLFLRCVWVLWAPFISSPCLHIIPLMFLPNIKWSMVLARGT